MSRPVILGALRRARAVCRAARTAHYAVPTCHEPRSATEALYLATEARYFAARAALSMAEGRAEQTGLALPCECGHFQCSVCDRRDDRFEATAEGE